LPSAEQLQRLPLRAVAAYAARAARRVQPAVHGFIDDDIIEGAVSIVETIASAHFLECVDPASVPLAASRVAAAAADAPRIPEVHLALMAILRALDTAIEVLGTIEAPNRSRYYAGRAAQKAERVARAAADVFDKSAAAAADAAARTDYDSLVKIFGEHDDVLLGDPIDLSESSPLGPVA